MRKSTISMVIFHIDVSLPEGTLKHSFLSQIKDEGWTLMLLSMPHLSLKVEKDGKSATPSKTSTVSSSWQPVSSAMPWEYNEGPNVAASGNRRGLQVATAASLPQSCATAAAIALTKADTYLRMLGIATGISWIMEMRIVLSCFKILKDPKRSCSSLKSKRLIHLRQSHAKATEKRHWKFRARNVQHGEGNFHHSCRSFCMKKSSPCKRHRRLKRQWPWLRNRLIGGTYHI